MSDITNEGPNRGMDSERPRRGRQGVSVGVAALIGCLTLVLGLASGLLLGAAGGFVAGRRLAPASRITLEHARAAPTQAPTLSPAEGQGASPPGQLQLTPAPPARATAEAQLYPYLGVRVQTAGGGPESDQPAGARVVHVEPDSPAEQAGLEVGDVITGVDEDTVASAEDLVEAIRSHDIGDTITLRLVRQGQEQTVEATLGGRTPEELVPPGPGLPQIQIQPLPEDSELQELLDRLPPDIRRDFEEMMKELEAEPRKLLPLPPGTRPEA